MGDSLTMIKSMTGYGMGKNAFFCVEIRSHNHRFCEILLRLPFQSGALEHRMREYIKSRISRGRIQVDITYGEEGFNNLEIDENLAKRLIASIRKVGESLGLKDDLSLGHLVSYFKEIIRPKERDDPEVLWYHIKEAFDIATDNLLLMRRREGDRLYKEILMRIKAISHLLEGIKERAGEVVLEYKERLKKRIIELSRSENGFDEYRLSMEVAFFAERSDITEELVRMDSHLEQMEEILGVDGPVGKRLDFLTQELSREIGTITSKTTNVKIAHAAVNIKDELEKIREQIQNVE